MKNLKPIGIPKSIFLENLFAKTYDATKLSEDTERVRAELRQALSELGVFRLPVAVRSSASDEDGADHSFAGQLDSFLFVPPEQVAARVVDVWRSGFSDRIVAYRSEHALPLTPRPPAVR